MKAAQGKSKKRSQGKTKTGVKSKAKNAVKTATKKSPKKSPKSNPKKGTAQSGSRPGPSALAPAPRIRVMVLYGGRSGEHEISLRSAASVMQALDPNRYEIIPVAIDKSGKWHIGNLTLLKNLKDQLPVFANCPEFHLPQSPDDITADGAALMALEAGQKPTRVDVIFPVVHGPLCEDGTLQGLLELSGIAYVGSGVLGSAVGMDKDVAKRLARESHIPVVPFFSLRADKWNQDREGLMVRISKELEFPVFVKPANMGSSVGVHKVKSITQLASALDDAFRYDTKILVEKAIDAREIEIAILENLDPKLPPHASIPGEIKPRHEFYSYEAKYLDETGAELLIPAPLDEKQQVEAQKIARHAFEALECEGMARVDLFLDKQSGKFYFNELNTIPGFTSISMYPKLWEHTGLPYSQLLDRLIQLAKQRHTRKRKLSREYLP